MTDRELVREKIRKILDELWKAGCENGEAPISDGIGEVEDAVSSILALFQLPKEEKDNVLSEKDRCKTCEHDNDSGGEYCNSCESGTRSNWSEAGWIKDTEIARLRGVIERIKDIALEDNGVGEKLIKDTAAEALKGTHE